MKISRAAFNLFLLATILPLAACKTTEEKKKGREAASLRFHVETNPDGTPHNSTVPIYRARPMMLNVERDPVLDEGYMQKAEVISVDELGGFGIKITFDPDGRKRLETLTTMYKGRHLGIFARWTEVRWLAAPLIQRRITDGVFVFTPDATREESERIVAGLNNVIKKVKKPYVF